MQRGAKCRPIIRIIWSRKSPNSSTCTCTSIVTRSLGFLRSYPSSRNSHFLPPFPTGMAYWVLLKAVFGVGNPSFEIRGNHLWGLLKVSIGGNLGKILALAVSKFKNLVKPQRDLHEMETTGETADVSIPSGFQFFFGKSLFSRMLYSITTMRFYTNLPVICHCLFKNLVKGCLKHCLCV